MDVVLLFVAKIYHSTKGPYYILCSVKTEQL